MSTNRGFPQHVQILKLSFIIIECCCIDWQLLQLTLCQPVFSSLTFLSLNVVNHIQSFLYSSSYINECNECLSKQSLIFIPFPLIHSIIQSNSICLQDCSILFSFNLIRIVSSYSLHGLGLCLPVFGQLFLQHLFCHPIHLVTWLLRGILYWDTFFKHSPSESARHIVYPIN